MYQINIDNSFRNYDTKTVRVTANGDKMVVTDLEDSSKVLFTEEIPEELKKSFSLIPEKRGYIKKDEMGDMHFTLIRYCDYHLHSEYSLLDGANKIKNIAAKSEGCTGISDHGAMFGVLSHFKAMDAALKKPIIGYEAYCETKDGHKDGCHLMLIVKNEQGWKNVCRIISEAETNMYKKPHVSYDMLERYHEGLICTSACLGGELGEEIQAGNIDGAMEAAEILQEMFGEDYYIEIQNHKMGPEEEAINNALFSIAEMNGIKTVGAIDAHYTNKDDEYAHEILLCIGTKKKMSDADRMKFDGDGYHIHTADEYEELFSDMPELISNTFEIVDKCNFRYSLGHMNMPTFEVPEGFSVETYFEHLCWEGFKLRFEGKPEYENEEYKERLEYEIKLIEGTGFTGYFLIVQDYVLWAKNHGIYVGPGRGSCVGSLACYCLRITELDPIPYGLIFERFINPERISPPDKERVFIYSLSLSSVLETVRVKSLELLKILKALHTTT